MTFLDLVGSSKKVLQSFKLFMIKNLRCRLVSNYDPFLLNEDKENSSPGWKPESAHQQEGRWALQLPSTICTCSTCVNVSLTSSRAHPVLLWRQTVKQSSCIFPNFPKELEILPIWQEEPQAGITVSQSDASHVAVDLSPTIFSNYRHLSLPTKPKQLQSPEGIQDSHPLS